ncbi:glucose-1-phosphate adenylyltransferase subunit GlgD [Trichococcus pasteurii]|uniref:Nucleotide-diphospho-sugar transferases n=1 Tax=Trichococcus pasteurii TaxID=43064 RepID=A0A1W1IFC4_9LACT|nr:glucose-1-phosphate adenylyltransferase subunit GlgD [Trichococcus pasteurii]SFE47252.1 glucose-1-phosphate adenylyltransferase [Trichococcus pasteurii]SLM51728.1 nucleotide-diphospho-sugar transferases [Trichococcus pasteurii]SSB92609.1 nucleotide-diphospho-sugar transferases [Trichococcus pasteurii]
MKMNRICAILNLTEDETALKPLTRIRPIASLPFASRYRLIDFNLSSISHAEIQSVGMFIAGSGRSIYDHIRSGSVWNLESGLTGGIFTYSQQMLKAVQERNGDALDFYMNHKEFIYRSQAEYVVIMGSKIVANIDIKAVMQHHLAKDGDVTVLYKSVPRAFLENRPHEKVLQIDRDEYLLHLVDAKDASSELDRFAMSMNMYFMRADKMLELIQRAELEGLNLDADKLIEHYLPEYQVNTYEYTGYLANIDSIPAYFNANMEMLEKNKFSALFHGSQNVITKVKNGAPTYYAKEAHVKNAQFATGCVIEGTVEDSLIHRKVNIAKDAEVRKSIIMQGAKIGEGSVLEYCILDKNVTIGPGVTLKGTKDNLVVIEKNKTITV